MQRLTLLFLLSVLLLAACRGRQGQIQPIRPTPTAGSQVVGLPIPVSFSELNENPAAYQNQLIRVSGALTRLELEPCRHRRGPQIHWGLIAEELRLDNVGLKPIMRLVPEGTPMTIDGWWRLYQGPLGCGKKPPDGFAWYLDAAQIIAPKPLPTPTAVTPEPDEGPPGTPPTNTPTATRPANQPGQPTATVGFQPTTTPPPGAAPPTASPTPSRTATPAATATSVPPPPPLATATPGAGYAPPPTNPTPLPTPTPGY